ncbi:MAG: pyridoxal-dependent decarboxylase, partial [Thermoanaerobaculia bacterium]
MSNPKSESDLRRRVAPMEMSAEEFRHLGHRLVDDIAAFLETLADRPVNRDESPTQVRALLPEGPLPEEGSTAEDLLAEVTPLLFEHSLFNGHPRFLGYITSSAAPLGALADLLAAAINPNLGGWQLSPVASEIERQSVRWIAELLGYPSDAGGLLVSGGNMANFHCFLAARRAKTGEGVRARGIEEGKGRLLAYASLETHTWLQKATDLFGHGTDSIRWIPVDADLRADVGALRQRVEEDKRQGDRPFLIVGNAGTVSTGAVDPLAEMADVAEEHDLWFHADGAYGAFAVITPDAPAELTAMSRADSIAVDPHKWLYAPLEAGCVLVREAKTLTDAFSYTPTYYRFTGEEEDPRTNFYELGLQNSRGFRALKVWLGLRQVGRSGYAKMIGDDIRLARELYHRVEKETELQAMTQELSITTFRYVPSGLEAGIEADETYLNQLNEELLAKLKASGEAFLSNAETGGTFALRACIVNFRTSLADIEALPGIVIRYGEEVDAELRPAKL